MAAAQVRIQLSTRQKDLEFSERAGPILVKTDFARYQLSTLVNTLLSSPIPIPFDFLVNGIFLRTTINEFLTSHGISAETTLAVEYVRAQSPPTTQASFEHDDWVGAVDVLSNCSPAYTWSGQVMQSGHERIISGSYDNHIRVWDMSGRVMATQRVRATEGLHVLNVKFITPTSLVSSSGGRLQLWQYQEEGDLSGAPTSKASLMQSLEMFCHTSEINSIAVHTPTQRILSASNDNKVAIWSSETQTTSLSPVPTRLLSQIQKSSRTKRQKLAGSVPSTSTPKVGPLQVLEGHTAQVTSVIFHPDDPTVAYTTCRDHAVRTWDLETAACVTSRAIADAALTSLCSLQELNLLAVGIRSNPIVLVDPRESNTNNTGRNVVMTLKGHRNDTSCLAANPHSMYGLASGSSDGTCRVWDVRNTRADNSVSVPIEAGRKVGRSVLKIPRKGNTKCDEVVGGQGVKVFDMCWDRDIGIVSVGEDKTVQVDGF